MSEIDNVLKKLAELAESLDETGKFEIADHVTHAMKTLVAKKKDSKDKGSKPKEDSDLRKKYEKRFGKLEKSEEMSTKNLKQWKKELQEESKGDKKLSKPDLKTFRQIGFALMVQK